VQQRHSKSSLKTNAETTQAGKEETACCQLQNVFIGTMARRDDGEAVFRCRFVPTSMKISAIFRSSGGQIAVGAETPPG
jgi:hypothetical protein